MIQIISKGVNNKYYMINPEITTILHYLSAYS